MTHRSNIGKGDWMKQQYGYRRSGVDMRVCYVCTVFRETCVSQNTVSLQAAQKRQLSDWVVDDVHMRWRERWSGRERERERVKGREREG